jgi:hypothetical protein
VFACPRICERTQNARQPGFSPPRKRCCRAVPARARSESRTRPGVAHANVYRAVQFPRDPAALTEEVNNRFSDVIERGKPDTAAPLVALHQMTGVALTLKIDWRFATDLTGDGMTEDYALDPAVLASLATVLDRARTAVRSDSAVSGSC